MIDFKSEIVKFKPMIVIDEIEESIQSNEIQDMMDLIKQVSNIKKATDKE